jgi:hypothetical protein
VGDNYGLNLLTTGNPTRGRCPRYDSDELYRGGGIGGERGVQLDRIRPAARRSFLPEDE